MGRLILDGRKAKVYENENGTYTVKVERTHNYDGIIETDWDTEIFKEDGMHSGGGYCTHNFPIKYPKDRKTPKERAIDYAESYNRW